LSRSSDNPTPYRYTTNYATAIGALDHLKMCRSGCHRWERWGACFSVAALWRTRDEYQLHRTVRIVAASCTMTRLHYFFSD